MSEEAQFTLVVVYHNEQSKLPELLKSFDDEFKDIDRVPFEFLFIDNASTDRSHEIISAWCAIVQCRTQVILRAENHMAKARQQALEQATTPWIAFVDADCKLARGWTEAVTTALRQSNFQTAVIGGDSFYALHESWHRMLILLGRPFPLGKKKSYCHRVNHVPTNNYLVHRNKAIAVGGFDSRFQFVGEDLDINVRIRARYEIFYDPRFSVEHCPPKSPRAWYRKMLAYGQAQSRVFVKYGGGVPLIKFLPLGLLIILLILLFFFTLTSLWLLGLVLLVPASRIIALSFFFYGLGELWGFVTAAVDKLKIGPSSEPDRSLKEV